MRPVPAKCEVINDINGELVNLYRVVQWHLKEFVRQFEWALSSRQLFGWMQETRPETLTDIQRAARFFYLQQHAFGSKVDGQHYGTATTGPVVNMLRIEETLSAAHLRLAGVNIEHMSWLPLVERYDLPHTLFYLDPPYWQTAGYGVEWGFENYPQMADFMRRCAGRVVVSINDHPAIREAFAGFWTEALDLKYCIGNGRDKGERPASGELVIANFEPDQAAGLFA